MANLPKLDCTAARTIHPALSVGKSFDEVFRNHIKKMDEIAAFS
jgi:hypothetical protein